MIKSVFNKEVHKDEFRLRVLLTNDCNRSCEYCLNDFQEPGSDYLPTEIAIQAISAYTSVIDHPIVNISGGEPGLHPDFLSIIRFAHELGARVFVNTNGTALLPEAYPFVNCFKVHVFSPNLNLISSLREFDQVVYVVANETDFENSEKIIDLYSPFFSVKIFSNFYGSAKYHKLFNIWAENMGIKLMNVYRHDIQFRYTGIQRNRGRACDGCNRRCITLKALWIFPDGMATVCPQGFRIKGRPIGKSVWRLVKAIEVLADKITGDIKSDDALKFTQAAANAANTICALKNG